MPKPIDWRPIALAWIHDDPWLTVFTTRQREVIDLLAQGESLAGVGDRLGLAIGTVQTHLAGAQMRAEIARRRAHRSGAEGASSR